MQRIEAFIFAFALVACAFPAWAQTTFCIVYSPNQSVTRRIITPDNDAECNAPSLLMKGEAILILPQAQRTGDKNVANALVAKATGKPTTLDRAVYVNGSAVVAVVLGDPLIDGTPPGLTFAAVHALAVPGDTWNGTIFLRDFAVVNPTTGLVVQKATLPLDNPVSPVPGDLLIGDPGNLIQVGTTVAVGTVTPP